MGITYPSIIPKVLIGFLYFTLLVSCTTNQTQETPTPGIPTATITSPIPTVRVSYTNTPTQNPVPSNTPRFTQPSPDKEGHYPKPSSTYTPTPTATHIPTPTLQPIETLIHLPTLPIIQPSTKYLLGKPSPEDLLKLIKIIDNQNKVAWDVYQNDNLESSMLSNEAWEIQDILDYEFNLHYPSGVPDPQLIWNYYPPTDTFHSLYPKFYLDLLTDAIYADLYQNHTPLTDRWSITGKGYKALTYKISLDEDTDPEWLLKISWSDLDANTWLVLDEGPGVSYKKLMPGLPNLDWTSFNQYFDIDTLQDFTGDGLTDVIFRAHGYAMGTIYATFYIAQGYQGGFKIIDQFAQVNSGYINEYASYKIDTPAGSRWLTVTLSDPNYLNWDCRWDTITTYRWPYGQPQVTVSGKEPPNTPDCYLARAVQLYDTPDNLTAIKQIEYALARFKSGDPVQDAKIAFSHYRLAVLYALEGMDLPARQHLEMFIASYTQSPAFRQAKLLPLLDDKSINPVKLCSVVSGADYKDIPEIWHEYANTVAALNAYPGSEPYPPAICPLRDILSNMIDRVRFNLADSPETALSALGIPIYTVQSYPVRDQAHPAWFVLINTQPFYLAAYVPGQEGWDWQIMYRFDPSIGSPQVFSEDVTHDGIPELAFAVKSQYGYGCLDDEQGYEIFLTTSSGNGYISMSTYSCSRKDKPFDFRTFLADQDGDGLVDWVVKRIKDYSGDSIYTAERTGPVTWFSEQELLSFLQPRPSPQSNLLQQLYESKQPAKIREELMSERDSLSTQDPFWSRNWQRLTYLIAVSYELEGQAEKAVQAFIQVITTEPHTLWGNLAAMHLK